jgi:ABC-type transport system involved in cytochrome c biogenesis ATPase subunit
VDVDAVCRSAAAQVGAEPFFDLVAGSCSTGQRRRLMVAQALVGRAPVLLLDEPLEDLDAAGIDSMGTVVRGWADAGGSVLLAAPEETRLPHVGRLIELGGEP